MTVLPIARRTAKLWSCTDAASLITFDSLQQHKSNTDSSSSSSGRRPNGIHRTRSDSGSNKGISPSKLTRSSSSSSSGGSSKQACAASRAIGRPGGTAPSHIDSASEMEFLTEITAAQFFYMDQFVLLTTGNKLHLCRYVHQYLSLELTEGWVLHTGKITCFCSRPVTESFTRPSSWCLG